MSIKNATFTTALLTSNLFAVAHPPSHASGNEPHFGGCPDASMCEYVNATTHVPSITGNIYPDCDANGEVASDPRLIAMGNRILQRWFAGYLLLSAKP